MPFVLPRAEIQLGATHLNGLVGSYASPPGWTAIKSDPNSDGLTISSYDLTGLTVNLNATYANMPPFQQTYNMRGGLYNSGATFFLNVGGLTADITTQ